jgi:hypothetical protein
MYNSTAETRRRLRPQALLPAWFKHQQKAWQPGKKLLLGGGNIAVDFRAGANFSHRRFTPHIVFLLLARLNAARSSNIARRFAIRDCKFLYLTCETSGTDEPSEAL